MNKTAMRIYYGYITNHEKKRAYSDARECRRIGNYSDYKMVRKWREYNSIHGTHYWKNEIPHLSDMDNDVYFS